MDKTDKEIIKAIDSLSPTSFVPPVKVAEMMGIDKTELGNRLVLLKKSGHVDTMTSGYVSSATLPNFISRVRLTDLGRKSLKGKRKS